MAPLPERRPVVSDHRRHASSIRPSASRASSPAQPGRSRPQDLHKLQDRVEQERTSKRPWHGKDDDDDDERRAKKKKKHLYVAFDDWENGFGIYKIDTTDRLNHHRLPEPALRLETPSKNYGLSFAAMEKKIFISTKGGSKDKPFLLFDTDTESIRAGPLLPEWLPGGGFNLAVHVGGVLYMLSSGYFGGGQWYRSLDALQMHDRSWSWTCVHPNITQMAENTSVRSYAVHPDDRTIFMSTCGMPEDDIGTYSFDTKLRKWRRHGEWTLPFRGRGYYDTKLKAWVGLSSDGYICSCKIPSRSATSTDEPRMAWVTGKEKPFLRDPDRHLRAALTCMGKKYCLVETVMRPEGGIGERDCALLRLTKFSLNYNRKGDLRATVHSLTHSYNVSVYSEYFPLQAFWM